MSRIREELKEYKYSNLIEELNNQFIAIKVHLYDLGNDKMKNNYPKPTIHELDKMLLKLKSILELDSKPLKF